MHRTISKFLVHVPPVLLASLASAQTGEVRIGTAAFADWTLDAPGVRRLIRPSDLPAPKTATDAEGSIAKNAKVIDPPEGALPTVPDGFVVELFATGFKQPRTIRIAPNGDIFLSESGRGRLLLFRASSASGAPAKADVFAQNLDRPYGIVFRVAHQSYEAPPTTADGSRSRNRPYDGDCDLEQNSGGRGAALNGRNLS
jgi:glucose/arabinose dehydrogenase